MEGTNRARELALRCSDGNRLAACVSQRQELDIEAAKGIARCAKLLVTGLFLGAGSASSNRTGTVPGASRSSAMAKEAARAGLESNSAENSGRAGLSP